MSKAQNLEGRLTYGTRTDNQEVELRLSYSNSSKAMFQANSDGELRIEGHSIHEVNKWDEDGSNVERTYKRDGTALALDIALNHDQAIELIRSMELAILDALSAEKEKNNSLRIEKVTLETELKKLKDSISTLKNLVDID